MKISGHGVREHTRLLAPLFGILTGIWALRMILDAAGAPRWLSALASMTVALPTSVLLAVLLLHARRFGSYANVVFASFLLNALGQMLIILAIVFSVLTGLHNVYTAAEYSIPGDDAWHVRHILGHLTAGLAGGTLIGAGVGCLLLWLLRTSVRKERDTGDEA